MRPTTAGLILFLFLPSVSSAHTLMTTPAPRNNDDGIKSGPCGDVAPTGTPTELSAGETFVVDWLETIDHPGYYRVAFSLAGDQGFEDNVLADNVTDIACGAPPCSYTAQITVPDQPCENCSLQLIQYMGNAPPYSLYYSCADITIVAAPGDPGDPGDEPPPDEPNPDEPGDPSDPRSDEPVAEEIAGGCSVSTGSPGATHIALLLAAILFATRRRRR